MEYLKTKRIKVPIYGGTLVIIQSDTFEYMNKKYGHESDHKKSSAVAFENSFSKYSEWVVSFIGDPTINTVVHESVHVVNLLFLNRGIRLDVFNDEAQAYLTGWVVDQIERTLRKFSEQ